MAGRRAAMAPYFYVDLYCNWPCVHRVPDFQWQLQAGAFCATRPAGRVADGAPLFPFRSEADCKRSLQSTPKARLHVCHRLGCFVDANRARRVEAGTAFLVGLVDGRIPPGAALAFPRHVGDACVCFRPSRDGGSARLEQFRLHADGMEEGPRISVGVILCVATEGGERGVRNDVWRKDSTDRSSRAVRRGDADPAHSGWRTW